MVYITQALPGDGIYDIRPEAAPILWAGGPWIISTVQQRCNAAPWLRRRGKPHIQGLCSRAHSITLFFQ